MRFLLLGILLFLPVQNLWAQLPVFEPVKPVSITIPRALKGDFATADCRPFYDEGVTVELREYWYIDDPATGLRMPFGETYNGIGYQPLKTANGKELVQGRIVASQSVDYFESDIALTWRDPLSLNNPWMEGVFHISPATETRSNRYGYIQRKVYRVLRLQATANGAGYFTTSLAPWIIYYNQQKTIDLGDLEMNCAIISG